MARPSNEQLRLGELVKSKDDEMFRLRVVLDGELKRIDIAKRILTKMKELADASEELSAAFTPPGTKVPTALVAIIIDIRNGLFGQAKDANLL